MEISRAARGLAAVMVGVLAGALVTALPAEADTSSDAFPTSCELFPADSYWRADVRRLPKHPRSASWMKHMSSDRDLHPDFGPAGGDDFPYGIPVTVVDGDHPRSAVTFDYAGESDAGPYPLGDDTLVEGGSYARAGDKHTVVVDRDDCRLYETWNTRRPGGAWRAGSGAIWDLDSYALRPSGWTSADAAGLPILPGLLRYEEVAAGEVDHAIRFTTDVTDRSFVWPARHQAGSRSSRAYPPMGARFRLKASYPIAAGLDPDTKVVLRALKKHGLVLADNGSPWFFQGAADDRWSDDLISELKDVPASAFEAVDTAPLKISNGSMRVRVRGTARVTAAVTVSSRSRGRAVIRVTTASGTPYGRVRLRDGGAVIGSATLRDGRATIAFPARSRGRHRIAVTYAGSSVLWPDATRTRSLTVTPSAKTAHLS